MVDENVGSMTMKIGKVYLVGAGPGDPGLMTVRGLQLLRDAQVVVYDQLVNPALLEEVSIDTERIFVGKKAGHHCIAQSEINSVLIDYAKRGHEVVRLKGGDPFVFGRGGEEAEALADAGVPFEIIPGVSSAVAVPAYAGIPLTHRDYASSFAVVTGHEAIKSKSTVDWAKLATAVDTLVILMGLHNLPAIVAKLLAHGRSPNTPVAVIRQGTTQQQATVTGTLADIVERSIAIKAPALIVVGDVVRLKGTLDWFLPNSTQRCGAGGFTSPDGFQRFVNGVVRCMIMAREFAEAREWGGDLERLATEELMDWAQGMDYFGDQPFVWDSHHGLDSQPAILLTPSGNADELLSHLSEHDRTALSGDRRRGGGRAQDRRSS